VDKIRLVQDRSYWWIVTEMKVLILNLNDCHCLKEDSDNEVINLIS
jgi:hypothetical protein